MSKRHRKYFIDEKKAIELLTEGYGLVVKKMNWYQFRISQEETDAFWDWYHTQGSVVLNKDGSCSRWGTYGDVEELAIAIKNYVYEKGN